jgi:hypothetical protein
MRRGTRSGKLQAVIGMLALSVVLSALFSIHFSYFQDLNQNYHSKETEEQRLDEQNYPFQSLWSMLSLCSFQWNHSIMLCFVTTNTEEIEPKKKNHICNRLIKRNLQ